MKITLEQAAQIWEKYFNYDGETTESMFYAVNSALADIPEPSTELQWIPRPTSDEGFTDNSISIVNDDDIFPYRIEGKPSIWNQRIVKYIPWPQDPTAILTQDEKDFEVWWESFPSHSGEEDRNDRIKAKLVWMAARQPKA